MYETILVTLDTTPTDRVIISHVKKLAKLCGSQVVLLHVADGWAARQFGLNAISEEVIEDRKYLENGRKAGRARAEGLSDAELYDSMTGHGFFVLISNMDIPNSQVLPDYYVRQTMEQFIDVGKNYTNLLPLRVHSEETFRGHLLISFIASATVQMLMNEMKERGKVKGNGQDKGKIKNNSPTVVSALMSLRNQKCKVYDDHILPAEPQAIANKTYELFSIDVPYAIQCRKD